MFLTSIFPAYSRLAVFAVGILLGIQVPSFVEQYNQRIDAHFREVNINISGFQDTADRLFDGDLEALIAYYANSNDAVFESDAGSIRLVVTRYNRLLVERSALDNNAFAVAMHVMFAADQEFYQEAMRQYSYRAFEFDCDTMVFSSCDFHNTDLRPDYFHFSEILWFG